MTEEKPSPLLSEKELRKIESLGTGILAFKVPRLLADHRRLASALHNVPHVRLKKCQFTGNYSWNCTPQNCIWVEIQGRGM